MARTYRFRPPAATDKAPVTRPELGGTGDSPVLPGDSPGGMKENAGKEWAYPFSIASPFHWAGLPNGTGQRPGLPPPGNRKGRARFI
jgi:hypothetical protein